MSHSSSRGLGVAMLKSFDSTVVVPLNQLAVFVPLPTANGSVGIYPQLQTGRGPGSCVAKSRGLHTVLQYCCASTAA
jgi:hypothetical protein